MTNCTQLQQQDALAVGDPRRAPIGRAVLGTLLAAATFVGFAYVTKEVKGLYLHTPWRDDPYDAVVSFTMFFVPLVSGLCLMRVLLCRRDEPLPLQRALDLLRGRRVALGAVLITLLTDWTSVVLRSNQTNWTSATALPVGLLALAAAVATKVALDLRRASDQTLPAVAPNASAPDWFSDILTVIEQHCAWLGPWKPQGFRVVRLLDRRGVSTVRRHPLATAASAAMAFGIAVAASQSIEEGVAPIALLFVGIAACGMFAFVMTAGSYLGLVRSASHVDGVQRRAIDAAVAGCASVPIAVGFRGWLWWIASSSEATAGPLQLTRLLFIVGVATVVLVFGGESLARIHGTPVDDG